MKARFVRVVHRCGWDVELIGEGTQAAPVTANFPAREDALAYARELEPEWIEVGEIVPASESAPQHHRWTTLRRQGRGNYAASPLNWGDAGSGKRPPAPPRGDRTGSG